MAQDDTNTIEIHTHTYKKQIPLKCHSLYNSTIY